MRHLRNRCVHLLALILLLGIVYFVGTSSAFFKGVILPKVGKSMDAKITVSSASISPFSHVILHDLKVQTTGPEPVPGRPPDGYPSRQRPESRRRMVQPMLASVVRCVGRGTRGWVFKRPHGRGRRRGSSGARL